MSNFPTKENPQLCKNGCGAKIYLSDEKRKGKYLPYNLDDSQHDCRDKDRPTKQDNNNENNQPEEKIQFDYNDVAVLDKLLKIVKHAVEHGSKEFQK